MMSALNSGGHEGPLMAGGWAFSLPPAEGPVTGSSSWGKGTIDLFTAKEKAVDSAQDIRRWAVDVIAMHAEGPIGVAAATDMVAAAAVLEAFVTSAGSTSSALEE